MLRKRFATTLALAVAASVSLLAVSGPANAAQTTYSEATADAAPIGLLVHFKAGFQANGLFGVLNGQGAVARTGVALGTQRALGSGWHVLNFQNAVSEVVAQRALNAMATQPGVTSVGIDRFIAAPAALAKSNQKAALRGSSSKPANFANLLKSAIFKLAPAVKNLAVVDAYDQTAPNVAQVKVSWTAPKLATGYKIVGYKIQNSSDGGLTFQDIPATYGPKQLSAKLTSGLVAGSRVALRVAAVTSNGKVSKTGTYSSWATATPTTLPQAPTFNGPGVTSLYPTTSWQLLGITESGGLPVTYVAVATAKDQPSITCKTSGSSCTFQGLVPGASYTVTLHAENAHGSSAEVSGLSVADPLYGLQWHLNSKYGIQAEQAWQHTRGSSNVTVAVIDSGITDHPDLNPNLWHNLDGSVYGYDFVSTPNGPGDGDGWDANPSDPTADNEWHGTHVSGIIAAASNNIGVTGVAPGVKLLEVRALGTKGGSSADLIAALNWAAGKDVPGVPKNQHPAQVINLSLGNKTYAQCDTGTAAVMQSLHDANVMVITAAGNDNSQAFYSYPGNCYPTINVGATGFTGDRAYYSNFGQGVDISAPGGDDKTPGDAPAETGGQIWSTLNDGTSTPGKPIYDGAEGTSMAAPMVSGIAALLVSVKPTITPDQIWTALKSTATPWPVGSFCATASQDLSCGIGIANAGAAVEYVLKN